MKKLMMFLLVLGCITPSVALAEKQEQKADTICYLPYGCREHLGSRIAVGKNNFSRHHVHLIIECKPSDGMNVIYTTSLAQMPKKLKFILHPKGLDELTCEPRE
ncbi:hypothetical protein ACFL2D_00775 [Patescibacteria group bacterium]